MALGTALGDALRVAFVSTAFGHVGDHETKSDATLCLQLEASCLQWSFG